MRDHPCQIDGQKLSSAVADRARVQTSFLNPTEDLWFRLLDIASFGSFFRYMGRLDELRKLSSHQRWRGHILRLVNEWEGFNLIVCNFKFHWGYTRPDPHGSTVYGPPHVSNSFLFHFRHCIFTKQTRASAGILALPNLGPVARTAMLVSITVSFGAITTGLYCISMYQLTVEEPSDSTEPNSDKIRVCLCFRLSTENLPKKKKSFATAMIMYLRTASSCCYSGRP
jgi:hypothetical protein